MKRPESLYISIAEITKERAYYVYLRIGLWNRRFLTAKEIRKYGVRVNVWVSQSGRIKVFDATTRKLRKPLMLEKAKVVTVKD